jgi:hypothetical protein
MHSQQVQHEAKTPPSPNVLLAGKATWWTHSSVSLVFCGCALVKHRSNGCNLSNWHVLARTLEDGATISAGRRFCLLIVSRIFAAQPC